MSPFLLAAAENREASPIALVIVLLLLVALVFLVRSMNKHLRKVPGSFSRSPADPADPTRPADPAGPAEPAGKDDGRG